MAQQQASAALQQQLAQAFADNADLRLQLRAVLSTQPKRASSAPRLGEDTEVGKEVEKAGSEASMSSADVWTRSFG